MSSTQEWNGTFIQAVDRCNAAAYTPFSDYAGYRVALQNVSATLEPYPCPWNDASEISVPTNGAALE